MYHEDLHTIALAIRMIEACHPPEMYNKMLRADSTLYILGDIWGLGNDMLAAHRIV